MTKINELIEQLRTAETHGVEEVVVYDENGTGTDVHVGFNRGDSEAGIELGNLGLQVYRW